MKENSIEEDIKIIENLQKDLISLVSKKFVIEEEKRRAEIQALSNILSDYKRALKENIQIDKIIERIYDFIWENDCCRYFSTKHTMCNQVLNFDSCLGNCKRHCINKYFENKAKESEE